MADLESEEDFESAESETELTDKVSHDIIIERDKYMFIVH